MADIDITATFRPPSADWTTLSKSSRSTIEALYRHPLSHNVEWSEIVALFGKLGTVDHKPHNGIAFGIGGERHRVHKLHGNDLSGAEVITFRHMLTRAGWGPESRQSAAGAGASDRPAAVTLEPPDLLVVIHQHEARLYHLDVRSADLADHVIRPYDPHHLLHHVSHNDQAREQRQQTPEDKAFYERIAQAVSPAGAVVVIGHGTGRSNAAQRLTEYLHKHHPDTFQKVACEAVANLSSLTAPQLLDLGRRALTAGTPPSSTERKTS